ncbi:alkane 1-monooxygenase [Pelomonas aquatica]|jgi:alkane 1-monooxygenase|nr:alkane 1-monooxygenase [Pelomonas aquatica]MCY4754016.1 alkane 1-monooxygenase [Pelomonas aquatica]
MSRLVLAPVAYGHFFVEHNRGHHRRVATPGDPASARLGESFWAFLPRTLGGSLRSAWHPEGRRLAGRGHGPWHWRNECLQAWGLTVLLWGGLVAWLGWAVLPFLLVQAAYGVQLLEVVNYMEHYGLLRQQGPDGRYERCAPEHSWNSNHRVSNFFLHHLQRHSDHHAHPARHYQALRHFEEVPQLPIGYAGLLLVAYVTPLWFRLMDRRVLAHYGGELKRANVQPGARARLEARWGKSKG